MFSETEDSSDRERDTDFLAIRGIVLGIIAVGSALFRSLEYARDWIYIGSYLS